MPAILWIMVLACTVPEALLIGADLGAWGTIRWRPDSYAYGAFWAGLLHGWLPNYPLQPYVMFVSYAFLHAGLWHLVVNMIVLVSLGRHIIGQIGAWWFIVFYMLCVLGGALAFAALTNTLQPMVGASGALFGLVAAALIWNRRGVSPHHPLSFSTIAWATALMIVLNLGSYLLASGHLAWETHLGGTIVGLTLAPFFRNS